MSDRSVAVGRRGEDRLRSGHPWVYKSDVSDVRAGGGDVVRVIGTRGAAIGQALYSDRSEIALRYVTRSTEPLDAGFWRARLDDAIRFRQSLAIDATAYRLVHGEADRLPSLVVDRYGDYLVLQALSQGIDRLVPNLVEILVELAAPA